MKPSARSDCRRKEPCTASGNSSATTEAIVLPGASARWSAVCCTPPGVDGRTGEFALERLTRFASGSGARGLSGSWYQPSLRGQGLVVQETTRNELIAIMFTFDQQRRPAWAVLQGTIGTDGSIGFGAAPFRASGGLFGRGYRPASLTPQVQGSASLSLNCTGGSFAVTLPAIDPAAQSFALERIAMPAGIACP